MSDEKDVSENFEFGPGGLLKQAREQKEIDINEVASRLKLTEQAILNIESDRYEGFPLAFYKGYVKNYAHFLGLDEQEFIENFNRYAQKNGLEQQSQHTYKRVELNPPQKSHKTVKLFARLVSLAIVLALLYSVYYFLVEKGYWNKFINSFDKPEAQQEQLLESDDNEGELIPEGVLEINSRTLENNLRKSAKK
ncbi:RodZ family helix-turn-helix domain-containing protein [Kangiella sp. TOML190]|uniref:helix-turn-helix domain-containing protein n=1 Tax=Kangiella sp. TOML190 TaxID=2931351 RepID=UPI00203A40CD|nr:helix-turn-helix domain-containing protein [Kangiella sp. TOML190]